MEIMQTICTNDSSRPRVTDKRFSRLGVITLWTIIFHVDAHAYIDPGSGAAIVTAILGAFGAVTYTCRKYYHKVKALFSKKNKDD
jgi:hypothetical protein